MMVTCTLPSFHATETLEEVREELKSEFEKDSRGPEWTQVTTYEDRSFTK